MAVACDAFRTLGNMVKMDVSVRGSLRGIDLRRIESIWLSRHENESMWASRRTFDVHVRIWVKLEKQTSQSELFLRGAAIVAQRGVDASHKIAPPEWSRIDSSIDSFYVDYGLGVMIERKPLREQVAGLAVYDWYWSLPSCTSHIVR